MTCARDCTEVRCSQCALAGTRGRPLVVFGIFGFGFFYNRQDVAVTTVVRFLSYKLQWKRSDPIPSVFTRTTASRTLTARSVAARALLPSTTPLLRLLVQYVIEEEQLFKTF